MPPKGSGQGRQRVLGAAEHVLGEQGVAGLTLDAVAQRAGVSKGGLLHHFRSKEALVEALLRRLLDEFAQRVEYLAAQEKPDPGRWLRAYVRASFSSTTVSLELSAMLLNAVTGQPGLLALLEEDFARWRARLLDDGVPPARATVIRMAADSAWLEAALGGGDRGAELRAAAEVELLSLAGGHS